MSKNKKPTMISLFSGCGGLDLGFKLAGFECIWANDFDRDAQAIYRETDKEFSIQEGCCIKNVYE